MDISTQIILFSVDLFALFAVYLVIDIGLNIQQGVTGIPNFGILFAVAGGAYITAGLSTRLAIIILGIQTNLNPISDNVSVLQLVNPILHAQPILAVSLFVLFLVIGGAAGAIMGLIASAPAVRLREDYLAITLLAFGEILNVIGAGYTPLVGGPPGVDLPDVLAWAGQYRFYAGSLVLLIVAIAIYVLAGHIIKTPFGRTLRAIRDNEIVARALGKNITRYRTSSIMIGSLFCGIAGSLWALYSGAITPTLARFDWTFLPWLMILIGGMGSNRGTLVGTAIVVTLNKLITYFKYAFVGIVPFNIIWLNYLLLGVMTILILIYRPEGIVRETLPTTKRTTGNNVSKPG
ncbi:MAG TPA: branched-chain amino acid ABC transporter permease [Terriglobales bacterium]|nr:branched-chain amino acid ABC transporter permease [Terriglobales bacterium]